MHIWTSWIISSSSLFSKLFSCALSFKSSGEGDYYWRLDIIKRLPDMKRWDPYSLMCWIIQVQDTQLRHLTNMTLHFIKITSNVQHTNMTLHSIQGAIKNYFLLFLTHPCHLGGLRSRSLNEWWKITLVNFQ